MPRARTALLIALAAHVWLIAGNSPSAAQDREAKVRGDQARFSRDNFWTYNNLEKAQAEARASGKPLLVIFRCIPCEACAQLDEQVIENNPVVRKWLSQFVPVRIVHANGMDLTRFQFDYDQSWAAFFMNADGTIYGRYGTRSHATESADDVSLAGFLESLQLALKLHARFPTVRESLLAKTGPTAAVARPEEFPEFKSRFSSKLDYEGQVVQSCIHCHQVGEATRQWHRSQPGKLPDEIVFPYPHPKILGLIMDPERAATVRQVLPESPAAAAGFLPGDHVRKFSDQPILSTADIQWVLHRAGDAQELKALVDRGGQLKSLTLALPPEWRDQGDISWRATSWDLRRMVTGGTLLESLSDEQRQTLRLKTDDVGLRIEYLGQWDAHAAAKRAGFQKDDVFIKVGETHRPLTESQLFGLLLRSTKPGDSVPIEILRGGKRLTLDMPIQP
jgi:serine protease Do